MKRTLKLLCAVIFIANNIVASETHENEDGNYILDYKGFMDRQNVLSELKAREHAKEAQQAEKAFQRKAKFIQLVQKAVHQEKTRQLKIVLSEQQKINRELAKQNEFASSELSAIQSKHCDLMRQVKEMNELISQNQDQLRVTQSEAHNLRKYMDTKDSQIKNLAAQLLASKEKNRNLEAQLAALRIEYEPIVTQKKSAKKE